MAYPTQGQGDSSFGLKDVRKLPLELDGLRIDIGWTEIHSTGPTSRIALDLALASFQTDLYIALAL